MKPKVVSFDLNGTLVTHEYVNYFWEELLPKLYAERKGLKESEAKEIVFSLYEKVGSYDIRWYLPEYWIRRLDLGIKFKELTSVLKKKVVLYPEALETLQYLKDKVELLILTNVSIEFVNVVFSRFPVFKKVFSSAYSCVSHFYLPKKDERFYKTILRLKRLKPHLLIHVGDDHIYDYKVPRRIGIQAYYINREKCHNSTALKDLRDFIRLIENILK